ncbi:MAG: proprotein convertase P-domain-containing protein, partial [Cellvibrionales bacterium]|nr:proprotein convertase P-domain-containing protein [Cellvibrionales bacterium]
TDSRLSALFPNAVPSNDEIEDEDIKFKVWTFNAETDNQPYYPWQSWPPQSGIVLTNLSELKPGQGYWIKSKNELIIDHSGLDASEIKSATEVNLKKGWNLMGFPVEQSVSVDEALKGINYQELWRYNEATQSFQSIQRNVADEPPTIIVQEFSEIEPNKAYWIYMQNDQTVEPVLQTLLPPDIDVEPLLEINEYGKRITWPQIKGDINWGKQANEECDNYNEADMEYDFPNTQRVLGFGELHSKLNFSIQNTGNSLLAWQASIPESLKWLWFEVVDENDEYTLVKNISGVTTNLAKKISVVVRRTGMPAGEYACGTISIAANGSSENTQDITAFIKVPELEGDYDFEVKLDTIDGKPANLHNPRYFMSVARDGDTIKGFLDDRRSLLVPELSYLSGQFVGDPAGNFKINGHSFIAKKSENLANPLDKSIRREFAFIGQRSDGLDGLSPLDLKGEFNEVIHGLSGQPIQLIGTFIGKRISAQPKRQDEETKDDHPPVEVPRDSHSEYSYDVASPISITDIKTRLSIDHPNYQDLEIKLQSPGDTPVEVMLHKFGDDVSLKQARFDDVTPSEGDMDDFNGLSAQGTWKLLVHNRSEESVARLDHWSLDIKGAKVYTVSGRVSDGSNPMEGATVLISGCGISEQVQTDQNGYYEVTGLVPCEYRISLLDLGYQNNNFPIFVGGFADNEFCTAEQYLLTCDIAVSLDLSDTPTLVVTPLSAMLDDYLPNTVTIRAIDLTDWGTTSPARTWKLFKRTQANDQPTVTEVNIMPVINGRHFSIDIPKEEANKGVYFVQLEALINDLAPMIVNIESKDITFSYLERIGLYLPFMSFQSSAGISGRNFPDSATFDINRPQRHDGPNHDQNLDSDGFMAEPSNPAYYTNAPHQGPEIPPFSIDEAVDLSLEKNKHFKLISSMGQPFANIQRGTRLYGKMPCDATLNACDSDGRAIQMDVGVIGTGVDNPLTFNRQLLTNPAGNLTPKPENGWYRISGYWHSWGRKPTDFAHNPADPIEGDKLFWPGQNNVRAEMYQEVDVSDLKELIDAGIQKFYFKVWFKTYAHHDRGHVIVEYKSDTAVLAKYDTGYRHTAGRWRKYTNTRVAPPGTRKIRVRLIGVRNWGAANDAYFDDLELRAIR